MISSQTSRSLQYHAYTIWLFTRSDLKTIVVPSTVFSIVCALSGLAVKPDSSSLSFFIIVKRIPLTAFWAWMNLLPFAIENQRQQDSIIEDMENKPWRPLASKRLTKSNANTLMLALYLLAVLNSLYLGGLLQCVALIGLGYWYNDLNGADNNCLIRNLINSCGYICFTSGALEVISDCSVARFEPATSQWLAIIGAVIFTTIQSQDMSDQVGDSLRKRQTLPLVIGDMAARWTIAIPVGIWSCLCPAFWQTNAGGFVVPIILGIIMVGRFLLIRTTKADKLSFRIYNVWIVSLYLLPLIKRLSRP